MAQVQIQDKETSTQATAYKNRGFRFCQKHQRWEKTLAPDKIPAFVKLLKSDFPVIQIHIPR